MKTKIILILFFLTFLILTCEKEKPEPPTSNKITISTNSATDVKYRSANISGTLGDTYGRTVQDYGHCWDTLQNPDISKSIFSHGSIKGSKQFTSQLQDLVPGKRYYAKAYFIIDDAAVYSYEVTFNTDSTGPPVLTTLTITNITAMSATSGGNIIEDGGFPILSRGICWNTTGNPVINDSITNDVVGTGSFTSQLAGLEPNTTYYIKAYATNSVDTGYGNQEVFITKDGIPDLTTSQITNIQATSATSGGNITDDGGLPVTSRGICWNTTSNPTIDNNITKNGEGTGSFTSQLTGLEPNTTYYVRAYAINIIDTVYSNQEVFITKDGIPKLTTNNITNITGTSATSGGNITDDGGFPLTARGVCWNTNGNPTVDDNTTNNGTEIGNFISQLTGLEPITTYYVRAFATNIYTTNYGDEIPFTTDFNCGIDIIYDSDGNSYSTVQIGDQCWMAENLKTTKYNNGTDIPLVTNDSIWESLNTPAYCWYDNNEAAYKETYGGLYNWYTVNSGDICPTGWHVPTDAEWITLVTFLGGELVAGGKLKEIGTTHWDSPNTGATNETGFTALPGGFRYDNFYYFGRWGYWWSATEYDTNRSYLWTMSSSMSYLLDERYYKVSGFSVRCIKD